MWSARCVRQMCLMNYLAQLRGADLLEAHAFGEFLVPLPEHEAQGGQRRGDTEEGYQKKKAEQDEIEESPCHFATSEL